MKNNWIDLDVRAMAESLRENIRNFGGFSPVQVRGAGRLSEIAARHEILRSLASGPKTGNEVMTSINAAKPNGPKISAGQVYPMLESLLDTKLVSAAIKKERKVFSITQAGESVLADAATSSPSGENASTETSFLPNWVDLKGDVPKAGARLAGLLVEVSKHGTKEQQQKATEVVNDARRRIHEILASE